ncbi:DUF7224 domain-containing protein [Saccharothrix australiensis]|uniref:DUF7224 domain-containing protein n=1 Tax=Saccharothrix australiensis TaxID=2072 RepID=A0A495VWR1_9PSEU|nr:hypothetical protein [Saccharothrix australiensis]RKT53654.1 hypothetical protein C8E97_2228 [Saccharothrix australiensis]
MTPLLIALRRGSTPIALPAMVLLGICAGSRGDGWSADWGRASGQLQQHGVLLVPLTATLAGWDMSRDRRTSSPLLVHTYPRSPLAWLLVNCVGALIAGVAAWVATFAVTAVDVRGTGGPHWSVVLLGPFCLVPAVLVGAVAGRYLPRYLTAPISAVAVWLALAFGSSSTDPLVARLSTVHRECCDVASQPVPATVTGQWLWITALAVAALAALTLSNPARAVPPAVMAVATAVAAVTLIQSTGARLTEARPPAAEVCGSRDDVTVCMWPEHAEDVDAWLDAAGRYRVLFADLDAHSQLHLENGLRPGAAAQRVGPVRPGTTEADLVTALARALVPPPPRCAATGRGAGPYPAAATRALLNGWLAKRIRPDVPAAQLVPPDQVAQLDRLISSSGDQQRRWYGQLVTAHRDCVTPPPTLP